MQNQLLRHSAFVLLFSLVNWGVTGFFSEGVYGKEPDFAKFQPVVLPSPGFDSKSNLQLEPLSTSSTVSHPNMQGVPIEFDPTVESSIPFDSIVQISPLSLTPSVSEEPTAVDSTPFDQLQRYAQEGRGRQKKQQVTSVSQLSDVQPTDWAFQALQSLVERYGCIAGYPDGTYKGNRALTRYEFAAGVNACLERITELIDTATSDLVTREDLAILQRLMEEFGAELAAIRGRVTALEARTAELEANQFSTTTKLKGGVVFAVADVFGEDGDNNQTVFQQRVNLNFITSFTGFDALLLSMYAGNVPVAQFDGEPLFATGPFDLPGVDFTGNIAGNPVSVKAATAEGTLSSQFVANTNNELIIPTIAYAFPVSRKLQVVLLNSLAPFQLYAPTLNPYLDDFEGGTGAISVFGEYNPIYTLVGGGSGAIFNYTPINNVKLTAGYLADGVFSADADEGRGLFNGGYGALGQLTWNVTNNFSMAGVYINSYAPPGRFGFNYNTLGVTGTAVANTLAGQDLLGSGLFGQGSGVITNGYGFQFNWQPSSRFSMSGWFSSIYPRLIGRGEGNILTYALTFAFPDLLKEGNLLGIVVGAEPYLTEFDDGNPQDFNVDVPLHVEAFHRFQLSDNISVTPGLIWLVSPNQDATNGDSVIGTVRTTFQF